MKAFLRAAEVMKKKDELLKVWAEQIRDLSYDIKDSLDEFKVHIKSQTLFLRLVKLRERHRIAIRIHNLKSRVEEVSKRNARYSLVKPISSGTEDDRDFYAEDVRNLSASNVDETELVGFSDSKKRLLEMIDANANDAPTKVIGVVGMGGLGKTALSRKIFESKEDIRKNFPCNAWITVSQSFHRIELFKDIICQLLGPNSLDQLLQELQGKVVLQVHHLSEYLTEELKEKRYFVVLDDIWSLDAWNWINGMAFPKNNKKGSRIVITTRNVGLAENCTTASFVYHLECLDSISSPPPLLRTLRLSGSLEELPNWIEQLTHLMKFYLLRSKLKEGKTMLILGALPNLMLLSLSHSAYLGQKLVFKMGAFPMLRTLSICNLDQLREIRFEGGSSPQLEKIEIQYCRLKSGIIGTIHLRSLKEISLEYESKVARLAQLEGEVNAHPNRPVLRMREDRRDHDLGAEAEGSSVEVEAMDPLPT